MIEISVRNNNIEGLYACVKPNKKEGHTVFIKTTFSTKLKAIGDIELNEEDGALSIAKKVLQLIEDISI